MPKAEIVDYPVSDLPERYDKARSAVYTRMDKLGIVPYKQGKKSFITNYQLELLDKLDDFLAEDTSRDIDDFVRETKLTKPTKSRVQETGQLARQQTILSSELSYPPITTTQNQITYLRDRFELLDNAASKGWLFSTSDLAAICNLSPTTIIRFDEFSRWGFTFVKRPERSGQELNWKVQSPKGI